MKQLVPALAASMALHAFAFAGISWPRARARSATVGENLAAVDIEIFAAGPTLSRPTAGHLEGLPREAIRRLRHRSPNRSHVAPIAIGEMPTSPAAAVASPAPDAIEHPGAPSATPEDAAPAVVATTGQPKGGDLDPMAFFERLQRAAQRCSGPRPGEGTVRFCVGADGAPTDVSLVQSTGSFALDDAALHCVIPGAAPFPHADRCLVVPLVFR